MSRIDDEAVDWVLRQSGAPLDATERAAFEAWCQADRRHRGAYTRALAIQRSFDQLTVQPELKPAAPSRQRRAVVFSGALAAGLAVAGVGVGLWRTRQPAQAAIVMQTAKGETRKISLADRSVVSISSASRLEVTYTDTERRLRLAAGEVWFEVAKNKDKPFIVEAGSVRVRAVGTAFAVKRHARGTDVLVTEGIVDIWTVERAAAVRRVGAGAQAFVAPAADEIAVTVDPAAVERKLAWRDGKLVLQHQTLAYAVDAFNAYNVRQLVVADPALLSTPLVGKYRIDQPEHFADDVHTLLAVPVVAGEERITIGKRPR